MAGLTGVLNADFTSFLNAVAKAEVSLKGFESGSAKVESALNKMANSFSGQKIIADANLMTKAIDSAGGASTLTAKEMARVNATLTEAIAKYKALGGSAPPAMQDLANATKNTDTASGGFMDKLGKMNGLLGALGIGMSVGAVVGFGKALLSDADALVKLHDKTAITLQDLQRMQIAGDDAGVSLESMTTAVNRLQKNLGSGDEGAAGAIRALGLNLDTIKSLTPENQFYEIASALQKVKDPAQQVTLAMELFGRAGAELLPVIKRGFDDVRTAAVGMSDTTIANLDWLGDKFNELWRRTKGTVANMIADVFRPSIAGFDEMVASIKGVQAASEKMRPVIAKVMPYSVVVDVKEFDRAMEGSNKRMTEAASKAKAHSDALEAVNKKIADATRDTDKLTDSQKLLVDKYTDLGLSNEDIALKLGISSLAIKDFKDDTKLAADRLNDFIGGMQRSREEAEKLAPKLGGIGFKMVREDITLLREPVKEFYDGLGKVETTLSALVTGSLAKMPSVVAGGTQAIEDATEAEEEATKATTDWSGTLSTLTNDFVQMAQIGGDSFGAVMRAIGTAIKAVEMVTKATKTFEEVSKSAAGASAGDYAAMASSYVTAGWAIGALIAEYKNAQADARGLAQEQANLNALQDTWNTKVKLTIQTMAGQRSEFSMASAVLEELGGVTNLAAGEYKHLAEEVTHAIAALGMADDDWMQTGSARDALELVNDTIADMGRVAMSSGGLVDRTFLNLLKTMKDFGVEVENVNDLLLEQLGESAEGLNELITGLTKGMGDSFTVTAEQAAGLGAAAAATFADMVERGMSFKDALDALQPAIDGMTETLKKSGVDGGDAFNFLIEMSRIASDEFMGPLSDAITGANKALKGLHNSGILNQTMFTGLEQSALQAYNKIIAGGGDGNAALMMMQPTLQTLWSLQRDFGYIVDDATQKLLDEAEAAGTVGDKHRPVAEQMLLATQGIERAVTALAKVFGVDLPASAESGSKRVSDALQAIKGPPPMDAPWAHWGSAPDLEEVAGAATGGMVTASGIQHFAGGGTVLNFRPRGSDTVPAMLTPGEMVLTPAQQQRLLRGGGGDNTAILAEFRAMRADQARRDARLNEAVAKAVKNEVQKAGGRRR